ncbi:hypothetical protein SS1G_04557 [Sclerotinia sclerotiorum 1980 UF-70]|uniref:Uncharacterized protein n=1 Tax=Sclerotinia sclerotiorum (strain ATCC 18683 / 1980 / Ss-1) TaxID=665079 RepID=A7EGW5_SCLS1|nr:hypothetical protein SS1G_04557 [Sclerotinia sclerotiorum 1980 UF-70]EDO02081.1 hypothetical protein SS1G_04557 [Sclerotinia sclerotiorum 1980 UF-70]
MFSGYSRTKSIRDYSGRVYSSKPPIIFKAEPLIPQIILNYKRHHTIGLQQSMMMLWACAGVPLGAFNIASGFNVALLVQPQILTVLSLVTWGQCWYYGGGWSLRKCLVITGVIVVVFAGVEVALVEGLKAGQRLDLEWPVILMGVLSAVLLSAGVLRHYYDIYIHRTVRGISFIFVGIDAAGDVFSLVSSSNLISIYLA